MINTPSPDAASGDKNSAAMNRGDFCVPLKSLSVDSTPPAPGDEVEFSAKGKVSRVEGDKAYVTPTEVNGEPVAADEPPPTPEDEDNEIMRIAKEADAKA